MVDLLGNLSFMMSREKYWSGGLKEKIDLKRLKENYPYTN